MLVRVLAHSRDSSAEVTPERHESDLLDWRFREKSRRSNFLRSPADCLAVEVAARPKFARVLAEERALAESVSTVTLRRDLTRIH